MRKWWIVFGSITVILCGSIISISTKMVLTKEKETPQVPTILKLSNPIHGPLNRDYETNALSYNFKINHLSAKDDIYKLDKPVPIIPTNTALDDQGVTVMRKNGKLYNHPVRLAHYTILFIYSYQMTKNSKYLEKAELQAQRLYDIAHKENNSLFFPYEFDVYLHNIKSEHLQPPWYSGMAQGQALSAFSRLYEITKDKKYLVWAQQTFNSFKQIKSRSNDPKMWVSLLDERGYLWFEEYPLEQPTHILNGFIFAIEGLYQYYEISRDQTAEEYLQAVLTTVYDNVYLYRVPGGPSRYGLRLLNQSEHYHFVHMQQLEYLYKLTGENYFLNIKQVFHDDFNENSYKKNQKQSLATKLKKKVKTVIKVLVREIREIKNSLISS